MHLTGSLIDCVIRLISPPRAKKPCEDLKSLEAVTSSLTGGSVTASSSRSSAQSGSGNKHQEPGGGVEAGLTNGLNPTSVWTDLIPALLLSALLTSHLDNFPPVVSSNNRRLAPLSSLSACRLSRPHNYTGFFWEKPELTGCGVNTHGSPSASHLGFCRTILGCFWHLLLRLKSLLAVRRALAKSWLLLVSSCR